MKHKDPEVINDYNLWLKFKNGDHEAFTKIYTDYYPLLLGYGLKIKNDPDFIKDCIQEVFNKIIDHVKTLGNTNNIRFYLLVSLKRKIFRKIRYDRTFRWEESYFAGMPGLTEISHEDQVIDRERMNERKSLLKNMIDQLTPRQKEALLMKFYLSMDYPDIAQLMELNIQSVRNLVHQAIRTLREQIRSEQVM